MARLYAVILAVSLCGCQTYGGSKAVAYTGGAVMLGSLIIGGSASSRDDQDATEAMVGFLIIGGLIALCGLAGMAVHSQNRDNTVYGPPPPPMGTPPPVGMMQPPPMQPPPPVENSDLERKRRAAWDLTQQARSAAYANDCPRVAYLAQRVIELDRATFDTVFAKDPYIVKCAPKPPQEPARNIPIPPLDPVPPPDPPPSP